VSRLKEQTARASIEKALPLLDEAGRGHWPNCFAMSTEFSRVA
jgi:hypothetical protein